jgi:transposase InsO family protein
MGRWHIDLMDFRTCPDGEYNWICNVQDHFTKFCWLKPLKAKSAEEVALFLYELMGTYGAPVILQSDNGREFRNNLAYSLQKLWPGLKIIHGRPRHPQSQGSIERSNGDIQGILGSWMRDNNSTNWSHALPVAFLGKFSRGAHFLKPKEVVCFFNSNKTLNYNSFSVRLKLPYRLSSFFFTVPPFCHSGIKTNTVVLSFSCLHRARPVPLPIPSPN